MRKTALFAGLILASAMSAAGAQAQARYPRAANLPGIEGDYLTARAALVRRGYVPLGHVHGGFTLGDPCYPKGARSKCLVRLLPEAECFVDRNACVMLWRARSGKILRIQTGGRDVRRIDLVQWAVPGESKGYAPVVARGRTRR